MLINLDFSSLYTMLIIKYKFINIIQTVETLLIRVNKKSILLSYIDIYQLY